MIGLLPQDDAPKFEPLSEVIRNEGTQGPITPSVIDTEEADKKKTPTVTPGITPATGNVLTPEGTPKFEPLDKTTEGKDVVGSENTNKGAEAPSDVFEFLKKSQLLHIPDDFQFDGTEESYKKLVEHDSKVRQNAAWDALASAVTDDRVFKVIEHGLKAGQFADLNAMFSAVNEGAQLDKIDITKEADAKTLLAKYYQDVNKFDAKRAEGFVQVALEQGTLKDDAALALKHYKDENEKRQTTLAAEAEAKRRFAETSFNNLRQGVVAATKELNYSGEVLKGVQTMMAPVIDSANGNKQVYKEDGTPMLWYEVVMEDVRENPKHLTQLLAMLQSYDSKEGFKIVQNQQKAEQSVGNKEAFDMLTKLKKNHVSDSVGTADAKTFVPNPGQIYDI